MHSMEMLNAEQHLQHLTRCVERMLRIGTVSDVDFPRRIARVRFLDNGLISDWLAVLDTRDYIPDYEENEPVQHTESRSGGGGYALFANHDHDLTIRPFMPSINDFVLVIFPPVPDADGFILGRFHPWK